VKGGGLSREADFVATTKALFREAARQGQVISPDDPLHHCIYACYRYFGYRRSFRRPIPKTSSYPFGHQSLQVLVPDPRSNHLEGHGPSAQRAAQFYSLRGRGPLPSPHNSAFVKQIFTNDITLPAAWQYLTARLTTQISTTSCLSSESTNKDKDLR
jgi:hypothetical protein